MHSTQSRTQQSQWWNRRIGNGKPKAEEGDDNDNRSGRARIERGKSPHKAQPFFDGAQANYSSIFSGLLQSPGLDFWSYFKRVAGASGAWTLALIFGGLAARFLSVSSIDPFPQPPRPPFTDTTQRRRRRGL